MARSWHSASPAEVAAELGVDPERGLSPSEARARLERHGPNELGEDGRPGRLSILGGQFRDVLIWILLAAALISGVLLDEWIDAGVILAIVVLNAVLGYVQEARAEDALARLKEMAAPLALVLRDGRPIVVPTAEVVPGDVLVLEAGDRIAADARVVEAVHLLAEESALTGESIPDEKTIDPAPPDAGLGDRDSMVHAGTSVAGGRGRAIVVATATDTEFGRIAAALSTDEPPTPLQVELDRVGRRLAVLALATAGLVFLTGLLRGNPAEAMLLTAVALAVAAIPEGLPAVVTITLSRGVQRMADRNAIVRRLPAVEALGAASVICTDKTGTLTRNEIRLQRIRMAGRDIDPAGLDVEAEPGGAFVEIAALCNDGRRSDERWVGDPTETALLVAVEDAGGSIDAVRTALPRHDEIAFDSRRKRMTTVHRTDDGFLIATKGAPEIVVDRCSHVLDASGPVALDAERRAALAAIAVDLASSGLRTLALARRIVPRLPDDLEDAEAGLELVAIVGMSDAVRDEAPAAVASAQRAGITVVMVTGDHEVTARAVAREVGIVADGHEVLGGDRLRTMSAEELAAEVDRYRVYARIDPLDKVKIVDAWQRRGEIVAMTGDGVNDAPALQAADIGVAMGSGTDVAKGASSMILADDDFATIVAAVREGRSIFSNLRTVVSYLLSCNVSEVLVMLLGFLVFGALGDPLLAVQLLWINLVTDGLPALALGVDAPEEGTMARPPDRSRNILSARRQLTLLGLGSVLAAAALGALVVGHYVLGEEWQVVRTMVFTTLVVVQLAHAWSMRQRAAARLGSRPERNRLLLGAAAVSFGLQLLVVLTPVGRTLFETALIPTAGWVLVGAATLAAWAAVGGSAMARRRRESAVRS